MRDLAYLQLLAREYPSVKEATSEIVNLMAICSLPKGTEYFFSDLHGEYEAFIHLLRSSSGIIREKIKETFGHLIPEEEQLQLANLIYYPERHLPRMMKVGRYTEDWQKITIYRLVKICREVSSKYTRSKVRKKMPKEFAYIIDELLHVDYSDENKKLYYNEIIHSIIDTSIADKFIVALCRLIQNLTIDNLHIIGDIFDRGPRADIIMKELMNFHDVDIQWGNHDISWMGAAAGNLACICNVLRIAISYNSFDVLEDGYGINLRPLSMFAAKVYQDDPCVRFMPKILDENIYDAVDPGLAAKMHKAIAVIQFKVEEAMMQRHPEYEMENRMLLTAVDYKKGTVTIEGKEYPMLDMNFPTIDPRNPLELTRGEKELLRTLCASFRHSEVLQRQVKFIYSHGGIYKCYNSNLLYHGCVPLDESGNLEGVAFGKKRYHGREYLDYAERIARRAWSKDARQKDRDYMWYLWCGRKSPLSGRNIKTFERTYVLDENTWVEQSNPYYKFYHEEKVCNMILHEFGLYSESSHIINGHTPVRTSKGEHPVRANGKLLVIDGGFCKSYHKTTGIAGYTLIFNSHGIRIKSHQPFQSVYAALEENKDIESKSELVETEKERLMVRDTDSGKKIKEDIDGLKMLLQAYRNGDFEI